MLPAKRLARVALATMATLGLGAGGAAAQAGNAWVTFDKQPTKLDVSPIAISDSNTEVVFRTGDLNKDGWDDVVAVRKSQASQTGTRPSILLMNDHGVLRDRTSSYAAASDVPGDSGFLTPCNTYDAAIGDVNGDGWPDVVTCAGLSDGAPKAVSHPRVYINRGTNAAGRWLGLRYEAARIPQLLTLAGLAAAPRFSNLGLADVTGDGFPDLYFVDFDGTETGIAEAANMDLDDRLLVNDGNGFFTDQSTSALTAAQLKSAFGSDVVVTDLNNDGHADITKVSFLSPPIAVRSIYNNPAAVGNFTAMGFVDFGTASPEGVAFGDLNHDGFKDVVLTDDASDKFRFGTGFNAANQMIWGPLKNFSFVTGADDGFARHVHIRDLDGNGWDDVLITGNDIDLLGCTRRLHIYHDTGSIPGDLNIVMKEEAELANGGTGSGWKGVVGMTAADEKGTYDLAFGDFDKDGDLDLIVATCSGAQYFQNETSTFSDLGSATPGAGGAPVLAGTGALVAGSPGTLTLSHAAPFAPSTLFVSLAGETSPIEAKGGTLVPVPWVLTLSSTADASGTLALAWSSWPAGLSGLPLQLQYVVQDSAAGGAAFSNALRAVVP